MSLFDEVSDLANSIFDPVVDRISDKFLGGNRGQGLAESKKRTIQESFAPRRIVFGRYLVKPTLVYIDSTGNHNRLLRLVFVVAAQHSNEIKSIYFDDKQVLISDGLANQTDNYHLMSVNDPDYEGYVASIIRLGDPAHQGFSQDFSGPWREKHKLTGLTAFTLLLTYNNTLFASGIPNISVELEGRRLYDPRTDQTAYSNNFALAVLSFMMNELNVPQSEIDMADFEAKADICDELVPTVNGETEPRFTVSGELELDKNSLENLQRILDSAGARVFKVQNKWRLWLPVYEAPVLSLNESHLAGDIRFTSRSGKRDRMNVVKGSYISESHEWERIESPILESSAYIANDGERLEQTFDYDLVGSGYQVQRLNKIKMEQSRYGVGLVATFNFMAMRATVGDRITFSCDNLGWSNKVFLVTGARVDLRKGVTLTLREDGAEIYDWQVGEALEIVPPEAVNLPDHSNLPQPSSVSITEELYQTNSVKEIKTRIYIDWVPSEDIDYQYDIQIKKQTDTEYLPIAWRARDTRIRLDDIEPDDYDVRVRAVNDVGFASDWLTVQTSVLGKTAPPPDVESLFLDGGILVWTYPTAPLDLAGFEVRVHDGTRQTWADATKLHEGLVSSSRLTLPSNTGGQKTFLVKAIDTTGNESNNAVVLTTGLGDPNVQNVILTTDFKSNNWPGTIIDGTIDGSNNIVADQIGGFYNPDPNSIFYNQNGSSNFYDGEFKKLVYEFTYFVIAPDEGSQLTIDVTTTNADSVQLEFIPPSSIGSSYVPFAGYVPAVEVGVYQFRLSIPSQFGSTAPELTGLVVNLDVPDITESFENVLIGTGGTRLPITKTYRGISFVTLTMQTDGSGVASLKVQDKDHSLGPLIYAYNSSGQAVQTTIDAFVRGY